MLRDVSIKNYKSISELSLELGRVNLFIGANGCGKSNILEAIIFGSAAVDDKLDNEFLANRGIRIHDPRHVFCGFDKDNLERPIALAFDDGDGHRVAMELRREDGAYAGWKRTDPDLSAAVRSLVARRKRPTQSIIPELDRVFEAYDNSQGPVLERLYDFVTYTPQFSTLRQLTHESAIEPLGRFGEGLFRLLRVLEAQGRLEAVNQAIAAIDWFDGLELAGDGSTGDRRIRLHDHFLDPAFPPLDQRSANEGFLFFLFHVALLVSPDTPSFFAVENVDESLNPTLCVHLVQTIARLSREHDKQVILTTHNPAALDGLDLADDEQRLFVIFRNADGHTRARRVEARDRSVRLSEAFIRGYLGGLPSNF